MPMAIMLIVSGYIMEELNTPINVLRERQLLDLCQELRYWLPRVFPIAPESIQVLIDKRVEEAVTKALADKAAADKATADKALADKAAADAKSAKK